MGRERKPLNLRVESAWNQLLFDNKKESSGSMFGTSQHFEGFFLHILGLYQQSKVMHGYIHILKKEIKGIVIKLFLVLLLHNKWFVGLLFI